MDEYILPLAHQATDLATVGGKGASLARLALNGLPVPDGFHVTTAAYNCFVAKNNLTAGVEAALQGVSSERPASFEDASRLIRELFLQAAIPVEISSAIVSAYNRLPGDLPAVAVRSSATAEDLPELSFAGQQETYLNIDTGAEVLQSVRRCWASLWTARAIFYRQHNQIDHHSVSLAVVVQLLVPAEAAGILFTINPINNRRDQALINAAWGLGEAIVGGAVTPDTITVDKASGQVIERQTADKQVMTVSVNGGVAEVATPNELRRAPVLDDGAVAELTRLGLQIEKIYAMPVDIEWALADGKLSILQARPVTALPQSETPLDFEWVLPKPKGQYMRGSLVDLMPSPVSPLFVSMGIPAIAEMGITRVMRVLTHSEAILPRDYITTINHYAYMGVAFSGAEWRWILFHMMPSFPRLMRDGFKLWRDDVHPRYAQAAARWKEQPMESLSIDELWQAIQELVNMMGEYIASILVATTGASAGTEMLFTRVYEKLVRREGDPEPVTFLLGFNTLPIQAEKSLFDLAEQARECAKLTEWLLGTESAELCQQIAAKSPPGSVVEDDWLGWRARFYDHLDRFGHIIYEVDFARPIPLDNPAPMFQAVKMYLLGKAGNPYERQGTSQKKREKAVEMVMQRVKGLRRWAFQKSLDLAHSRVEVREDAIADIGLGYPALRRALVELGGRMVVAGLIRTAEDIYYLEKSELENALPALAGKGEAPILVDTVRQRQVELDAVSRLNPPPMLPPSKKYMGIDMSHFIPSAEDEHTETALKGIGASAGRVTAPARVLSSPQDFDLMQPGEVIVAPITTPAWTPLFAMASAVVTDIGGPLSHGSIVAREYGIPAVLGTGLATRRIHSGQIITVDGSAGTVTLKDDGR